MGAAGIKSTVLNLPPPNVSGQTEARTIATLAEIWGVQITPRFFSYGPVCCVAMATPLHGLKVNTRSIANFFLGILSDYKTIGGNRNKAIVLPKE